MAGGETYLSGTSFSVEDYVDLPGWGAVQGMCILPNGNMLVSRLGCGVFGVRPWGAGSVKVPLPPDVRSPKGLALLGDGTVLICDAASHCLWAAAPSGAACRLFLGSPNVSGWRDGAAERVLLRNPSAVAVSADGSVVGVADTGNHCVRIVQVGSDGCAQSVATVGGRGGVGGYLDGVAGRSLFNAPCSVTWSRRFMVVCDAGNHCVRLLAEENDGGGGSTWRTTTVAGCGRAGLRDGRAAAAMFNHPCGATFAASGALLVADKNNSRIRAVRAGVVSTLSGALGRGSREGCPLARAQYNAPAHVMCLGVNDTIFIADAGSGKIKLVRKDRDAGAAEQPPQLLILGAAPSSPSHNVVSFVHPGAAAQAAAAAAKRSPVGGQRSASPRERRKAAVPVFARRASASPKAERAEWAEELSPSPSPQPQPPSRRRTGAPAAQPPETIGASLAEKEVAGVYQRWAGVSGSGLSCTAWLRFLGACRLLGAEQAAGVRRVSTAAAGLVFFGASGGGPRLDFEGFCRALNKLAASFEPRMQPAKLMWSHILPHHHHHSGSRGGAAASAAADADASDVLEPHLLLLLTLNEDVFLRLFKHFVAKGHGGGGGGAGAGGVTDRMLNMHGWLAFLRRFRVLPDLLNRGAAEAHAVLSVEGALFVALVSPAAAGYADSDADVLRRHNAPTDFASAGYRRPDAPLLLSFPEFLEAVCRVAASCYGRTAWDRRSHPTPYHQLAALISSLNVSPAADEFAGGGGGGGGAPLFQVPPAPQQAEAEVEVEAEEAAPATPASEEGVGVGLASPVTALAEGYEERFNDKAPDVPVLKPSLLGALGGGGGAGSPEEDGLECDVRSAVQEALAMLPLSEIAALDVKLRPSFVGGGGGGGGSAGWAVRQQGGGSVGDPCDSVEQMRREELAKVVARYERARARMLEEAVREEVGGGGAVTPPLTSAAKLRTGGPSSSRRRSAKARRKRGGAAEAPVLPESPASAPASARGPTPHPDVVAAPSASALSDLSGISAIYSVGGGGSGGGGVGEEVSVEPITL
eukprot:Rhum_TRINITY_DN13730_c0_g1::Rhum_TRINITY_DN13730_c0_g1_i1::g.63492::m.63492